MPGLAPIAVFGFNRPVHLHRCLASIAANAEARESLLYFFLDGPRTPSDLPLVRHVRGIARAAGGFCRTTVVEREGNWGLARNVIDGVTQVLARHGKIIVIEDDLVVSPAFLAYMNQALERYERSPAVFSVSGYNFPRKVMRVPPKFPYDAFFVMRHMCWGWGTWKSRWDRADWDVRDYRALSTDPSWRRSFMSGGLDLPTMLDQQMNGRVDSWAIRWTYAHFVNHAVCLVPVDSYVNNLGMDGTGVHSAVSRRYLHPVLNRATSVRFPRQVYVDPVISRAFMGTARRRLFVRVVLKLLSFVRTRGGPPSRTTRAFS